MSLWNLIHALRGRPAARRSLRRPGQGGRSFRPVLEALEDRCLLSYSITDLGTLGGARSEAYGINNSGQVVGKAATAGDYHAFLYDGTVTPPMQDLGTLGGPVSQANGINASGQVVGWSNTAAFNVEHAFLYDATATPAMQDLGTLGGNQSVGYGINASGQVVGGAVPAGSSGYHAFLYDATATPAMQDLGTLGGSDSFAFGINTSGQVVGYTSPAGAFLYDGNAMLDLNGQIPPDSGWVLAEARGINDNGQIVGSGVINGQVHAFLLTPDAGPGAGQAPPRMLAAPSALSAPANPSFFVAGGSVVAAGATLVSAAAMGTVLSPAEQRPISAPTAPAMPGPDAGATPAAPALALNLTVTPAQRASPAHGSLHATDSLDLVFAGLGEDLGAAGS
jgi:probable HAF family extracellular repeat protein